ESREWPLWELPDERCRLGSSLPARTEQTNFQVFRLIDFFAVQQHGTVGNTHHQPAANRPADVDFIPHKLAGWPYLSGKIAFTDAYGAAFSRRSGPAQPESHQLPHGIKTQASGHHGIPREMAFEEPEIRMDIEFRDDIPAFVRAAVEGDFVDAVQHKH